MRITNNMMAKQMLQNLNKGLERLARSNDKLSSGKEVSLPSHDPAAVARIMRLRTGLMEIDQYQRNANEMTAWLDSTDSALGAAGDALQRVRELTINGANSSLPQESFDALADEIGQIMEGIVHVANSTHGSRYIFAGFQTKSPPFVTNGDTVEYRGDEGVLQVELGVGISLEYSVSGNKVFPGIFQTLKEIQESLRNGDVKALGNENLEDLTKEMDNLLRWRSEAGAKINRLEMTKERITDTQLNLTKLLSDVEDIDVAKVIMELRMQENAYQAALSSGARIIQPSLLDFLR